MKFIRSCDGPGCENRRAFLDQGLQIKIVLQESGGVPFLDVTAKVGSQWTQWRGGNFTTEKAAKKGLERLLRAILNDFWSYFFEPSQAPR